jgi:hypothetical protein
MKHWISGAAAVVLFIATPVHAQESRPLTVEAGVVMGIIAQPYASFAVGRSPWVVRASGGGTADDCYGAQLNVGRVLRDESNARHSVSGVFATFRNACWYDYRTKNPTKGQYAGVMYDFQAKGFFLEFGPAFGAKNPFVGGFDAGLLGHIYGQVGYVHRFGKKYEE